MGKEVPLGYVEVSSEWALPRVKAALDYEEEKLCEWFAHRVNSALARPGVSGMWWWKKSRPRTLEEAWLRARSSDFYGESVFSLEYWLESDKQRDIQKVLWACEEQSSVIVSLDKYWYLFKRPWRTEHQAPRNNGKE